MICACHKIPEMENNYGLNPQQAAMFAHCFATCFNLYEKGENSAPVVSENVHVSAEVMVIYT